MIEESLVTSKGQITIPKSIRDALKIREGSRVMFILEHGEAVMLPKIKDSFSALKELRKEISFTGEEIKQMIAESKKEWGKLA